jgi:hypothetical protein
MKFGTRLATLLLGWGMAQAAYSYPAFIGYGYTSCIVCHFNAFGGGPLTDYGRALSATAIAAKPVYNPDASDEELGRESGFLGSTEMPDWLRADASFRGLLLASQVQSANRQSRFIPMKLDTSVIVKPTKKLWAVANVGLGEPPHNVVGAKPGIISREHYVAYQFAKSLRVYTGLLDVAFGLRIPDHTAFSRSRTLLAQNDQTHGVLVNWSGKEFDLGVQGFMGNLTQNADLRLKGGASTFELDVAPKVRLGTSAYYASNDYRRRLMGSVHVRVGSGEGSSVISEAGLIRQSLPGAGTSTLGSYYLIQTVARLARGLNFLVTGEYYTLDTFVPGTRAFRIGPGFQYFPMQRVEFRLDLQSTREIGASSVTADNFDLLTQVHLWF